MSAEFPFAISQDDINWARQTSIDALFFVGFTMKKLFHAALTVPEYLEYNTSSKTVGRAFQQCHAKATTHGGPS